MVAEPPPYTSQAVYYVTPDQAHAAAARGLLKVSQMQRLLGGPPLTNKGLFRSPVDVGPQLPRPPCFLLEDTGVEVLARH